MARKNQPYFRIRNADKALELLKQWRYESAKALERRSFLLSSGWN